MGGDFLVRRVGCFRRRVVVVRRRQHRAAAEKFVLPIKLLARRTAGDVCLLFNTISGGLGVKEREGDRACVCVCVRGMMGCAVLAERRSGCLLVCSLEIAALSISLTHSSFFYAHSCP